MAFFGLEAYGSDDENGPSLSDSSDSDSDSEDAAAAIVAAAPVALGPEPPPEKSKPSALDLFDRVDKPLDFLTRPMDKLGYTPYAPTKQAAADAYDVEEPRELAAKHRASATVSSAPKRYRADEIAAKERRMNEASMGDAERALGTARAGAATRSRWRCSARHPSPRRARDRGGRRRGRWTWESSSPRDRARSRRGRGAETTGWTPNGGSGRLDRTGETAWSGRARRRWCSASSTTDARGGR